MNEAIRTQISAFVDGELPDSEADLLLRRMCQDATLRREAAEFLELGRVMRGESGVKGVDSLRQRIAVALDNKVPEAAAASEDGVASKAIRPLLGFAVAASVALVALYGLQLTPGVNQDSPVTDNVAEVAGDPGYTVPQQVDERLRQYNLSHGASLSELGANSVNARLVSLRLSEEQLAEEEEEEQPAVADEEANDEPTTQP
ncbi:MAG: sigma-E factor negative regulatory protein [Woeseiaceae bacterium]